MTEAQTDMSVHETLEERLGLLLHLISFLSKDLMFGKIADFRFSRSVGADPVGKRNLTDTRGPPIAKHTPERHRRGPD